MQVNTPWVVLVGSVWYQCNSCKSCNCFAPTLLTLGPCCRAIGKAMNCWSWVNKKMNQKSMCKPVHWSSGKKQWRELYSNPSLRGHPVLPNRQHSKDWSITPLIGLLGIEFHLILNSWILWLVFRPRRNWNIVLKNWWDNKLVIFICCHKSLNTWCMTKH